MLAIALIPALWLGQAGLPPLGDAPARVVGPEVVRCDACGVNVGALDRTIAALRSAPRPHDREDAARALGAVKPTCHPEAVHALAASLGGDPNGGVRLTAAESLARVGDCNPEAHLALARAADDDPKLGVRIESRQALRDVQARCTGPCAVCDARFVASPVRTTFVPILAPRFVRNMIPTTEVRGPNGRIVVNPKRPIYPPIVDDVVVGPIPTIPRVIPDDLDSIPIPEPLPSPRLAPIPETTPTPVPLRSTPRRPVPDLDDLPPADPTPAPIPAPATEPTLRRTPTPPAPGPEAAPIPVPAAITAPRRTSAKPVAPPAELPPLEGPSS